MLGVADHTGVPSGTPVGGSSGSSFFGAAAAAGSVPFNDGKSANEFISGGDSGWGAASDEAGG